MLSEQPSSLRNYRTYQRPGATTLNNQTNLRYNFYQDRYPSLDTSAACSAGRETHLDSLRESRSSLPSPQAQSPEPTRQIPNGKQNGTKPPPPPSETKQQMTTTTAAPESGSERVNGARQRRRNSGKDEEPEKNVNTAPTSTKPTRNIRNGSLISNSDIVPSTLRESISNVEHYIEDHNPNSHANNHVRRSIDCRASGCELSMSGSPKLRLHNVSSNLMEESDSVLVGGAVDASDKPFASTSGAAPIPSRYSPDRTATGVSVSSMSSYRQSIADSSLMFPSVCRPERDRPGQDVSRKRREVSYETHRLEDEMRRRHTAQLTLLIIKEQRDRMELYFEHILSGATINEKEVENRVKQLRLPREKAVALVEQVRKEIDADPEVQEARKWMAEKAAVEKMHWDTKKKWEEEKLRSASASPESSMRAELSPPPPARFTATPSQIPPAPARAQAQTQAPVEEPRRQRTATRDNAESNAAKSDSTRAKPSENGSPSTNAAERNGERVARRRGSEPSNSSSPAQTPLSGGTSSPPTRNTTARYTRPAAMEDAPRNSARGTKTLPKDGEERRPSNRYRSRTSENGTTPTPTSAATTPTPTPTAAKAREVKEEQKSTDAKKSSDAPPSPVSRRSERAQRSEQPTRQEEVPSSSVSRTRRSERRPSTPPPTTPQQSQPNRATSSVSVPKEEEQPSRRTRASRARQPEEAQEEQQQKRPSNDSSPILNGESPADTKRSTRQNAASATPQPAASENNEKKKNSDRLSPADSAATPTKADRPSRRQSRTTESPSLPPPTATVEDTPSERPSRRRRSGEETRQAAPAPTAVSPSDAPRSNRRTSDSSSANSVPAQAPNTVEDVSPESRRRDRSERRRPSEQQQKQQTAPPTPSREVSRPTAPTPEPVERERRTRSVRGDSNRNASAPAPVSETRTQQPAKANDVQRQEPSRRSRHVPDSSDRSAPQPSAGTSFTLYQVPVREERSTAPSYEPSPAPDYPPFTSESPARNDYHPIAQRSRTNVGDSIASRNPLSVSASSGDVTIEELLERRRSVSRSSVVSQPRMQVSLTAVDPDAELVAFRWPTQSTMTSVDASLLVEGPSDVQRRLRRLQEREEARNLRNSEAAFREVVDREASNQRSKEEKRQSKLRESIIADEEAAEERRKKAQRTWQERVSALRKKEEDEAKERERDLRKRDEERAQQIRERREREERELKEMQRRREKEERDARREEEREKREFSRKLKELRDYNGHCHAPHSAAPVENEKEEQDLSASTDEEDMYDDDEEFHTHSGSDAQEPEPRPIQPRGSNSAHPIVPALQLNREKSASNPPVVPSTAAPQHLRENRTATPSSQQKQQQQSSAGNSITNNNNKKSKEEEGALVTQPPNSALRRPLTVASIIVAFALIVKLMIQRFPVPESIRDVRIPEQLRNLRLPESLRNLRIPRLQQ